MYQAEGGPSSWRTVTETLTLKANLSETLTHHDDELNKINGIGRGTNLLWLADKKYFTTSFKPSIKPRHSPCHWPFLLGLLDMPFLNFRRAFFLPDPIECPVGVVEI